MLCLLYDSATAAYKRPILSVYASVFDCVTSTRNSNDRHSFRNSLLISTAHSYTKEGPRRHSQRMLSDQKHNAQLSPKSAATPLFIIQGQHPHSLFSL